MTVISCGDKLGICASKVDLLKKILRHSVEVEAFIVPVSLNSSEMQWKRLHRTGQSYSLQWGSNSVGSIVKLLSVYWIFAGALIVWVYLILSVVGSFAGNIL